LCSRNVRWCFWSLEQFLRQGWDLILEVWTPYLPQDSSFFHFLLCSWTLYSFHQLHFHS
jgi:hypothetical protein